VAVIRRPESGPERLGCLELQPQPPLALRQLRPVRRAVGADDQAGHRRGRRNYSLVNWTQRRGKADPPANHIRRHDDCPAHHAHAAPAKHLCFRRRPLSPHPFAHQRRDIVVLLSELFFYDVGIPNVPVQ
jgi:hypothetical protein